VGALITGALGIGLTLVSSDADKWPLWLRPYHRWGWWAILTLLLAAVVLAVWQVAQQQHHAAGLPEQRPLPAPSLLDRLHPSSDRGPLVSNLPARNQTFTGRADLLDQLHQHLRPGQVAAVVQVQAQTLHGLGGVGKTQLALEYAHRNRDGYDLIWWIGAEQPATLPGQLVALARRLGLPEQPEQAETVQALWDALRQRDRWLLVFDNAEDAADLHPWWPPDSGRVLVTSRSPNWAGLAVTIAVDVLPRAEALALLRRRLGPGSDDATLDRLAEALGDLPLALEQAAAYLEETTSSPAEYLALLGEHARELFALGRPATAMQTIATTWTVAFQRLREQDPAAEDLLVLYAFLAADDIPRALPTEHLGQLPARLAKATSNPLSYQRAIGCLRRYGLLKASDDGTRLSMHRLVQAVARQQLASDRARQWAAVALRLVHAAFPTDPTHPDIWPTCARLLPHALTITDHTQRHQVEPVTTSDLLNMAAGYLQSRGRYPEAQELLERALALVEATYGPDHPVTAARLTSLGALFNQGGGDLDRARTLLERALSINEARLGPDHPDTAVTLDKLALILADQGDLDDAQTLLERALASRETKLGPEHPDTAQSLANLAGVLANLGDYARARLLLERALAIRETKLGPEHPDTTRDLTLLAFVLAHHGDPGHGRTVLERAVRIREARLGPDHPVTANGLGNLAYFLYNQGDLIHARPLFERAVAIFEAGQGPGHHATPWGLGALAWSLGGLASVLANQGDLDRARPLAERVLAIREAHQNPDHPAIAGSLTALASILYDQGDLDRAHALRQRALTIREARFGPDHPKAAPNLSNLALILYDQGDLDRARLLFDRALAICETWLAADHPTTGTFDVFEAAAIAWTLATLGKALQHQGDLDGARTLHERALAIFEAHLGADHPDTAQSLTNLAEVLADQGDLDSALTLHERAFTIRQARLGADCPTTQCSRERLAAVVTALRDHQ